MKTGTLVILILLIGGILIVSPRFFSETTPGTLSRDVEANEHIKGSFDAPVMLVEYSDFQCPACAAYYPVVKSISDQYGDQVSVVYRHFPLRSHPRAEVAALASEAAALQGKFFEMHDILFENQTEWSQGDQEALLYFSTYAEQIGLNVEQFESDFDRDDLRDRVQEDYASGLSSNVTGTPTFYLQGEKLVISSSRDLYTAIEDALNQIQQTNTATSTEE